jgi:bleomycin hydrolase
MKRNFLLAILFLTLFFNSSLTSQTKNKNKAVFKESKNEFYENMKEEIKKFDEKEIKKKKSFKVDFTDQQFPIDIKLYKQYWHNTPINQGITGTCWSFSATSYLESEIYRLTNQKIKLSEMYTVY